MLSNAIKFAPDGVEITVKLMTPNEYIIFEVSNTGPTKPKNEKEKIFNKFYRLSQNKLHSGQGLGLYFCKRTVKKLKGEQSINRNLNYPITGDIAKDLLLRIIQRGFTID